MSWIQKLVLIIVAAILVAGLAINRQSLALVPGVNTLVSINSTGNNQGGNGASPGLTNPLGAINAAISADGKYVAFNSNANNLVQNDTNTKADVFVRNLSNGTTARVSVSSSGVEANHSSVVGGSNIAISRTGRYVVFPSLATNLIDGQTSTSRQLYMRDTVANTTTIVTALSNGTLSQGKFSSVGGVSSDGRFVLWQGNLDTTIAPTETNVNSYYVYLTDLKTRTTQVLNHPPAIGQYFVTGFSMSCDGSFVALSTKLQLDSSDTDSAEDVYLIDVRNGNNVSGITTISNTGAPALLPSISCNGDYITFRSADSTFSSLLSSSSNDQPFVYDRVDGTIKLVNTTSGGLLGNGSSYDSSAVDDKGNVLFASSSTNLISGTTTANGQVFLKHADTGETELVSKTSGGSYSNGAGKSITISSDGKTAVYGVTVASSTLLSSDTNGYQDIIASSTGL